MIQLMLDQLAGLKGKIANVDKEIAQRARGNEVTRRLMTIPAGSDGETNFGKTSVAAPQAASSSVARYSFTAPAGPRRIAIPPPILPCDRTLLVGVRRNQAGIDGKAFSADQTGRNTCLYDPLEYATKNFSLTEALVAGSRERRMIRGRVLNTEFAEPSISKVHLHFTADQPLRTDRKDISHDQHPDHQFRIDRRATHGR